MLDYYLKVFIDENSQHIAYFGYKEYFEDKTELLKTRVFPLDVLGEKEPKILELVAGPVIGIYYERISKDNTVCETQYGFKVEGISEDTIEYLDALCKEIVLESKYDDLLKPPSVDEQVEDFIKEFFENDDTEALEQKDFLAEFFDTAEDEVEEIASSDQEESTEIVDVVAQHFETVEEEPLEEKDFLAEFFAELEEDEKISKTA